MKNSETVSCLICDSDDLEPISHKGQFGIPTHVCICKNCGLSFLSPRWDSATYLDFYTNEYDKYFKRPKVTLEPEKSPFSYFLILRRLKTILKHPFQPKRILDIGSGDGTQLSVIQKYHPSARYFAIEPSKSHRENLEDKGITFVSNDIDADWDKDYQKSFDFIIMRHVLEHFLNPVKVLAKLKKVLTDDGFLYIAVPNSLNPNPPLSDSYFRVVHTFYFNITSIKNVLYKAGYEIIAIEEGDESHQHELFLVAKRSTKKQAVEINSKNFDRQKKLFIDELKKEQSLPYKINKTVKKAWGLVVSVKKLFLPNPIIKNKN